MLAANYLPHGYWFYTTGWIPRRKDRSQVDAKLIDKYSIAVSRPSRTRRKRLGYANVHYLRHDGCFVMLATHGKHQFFDEESDVRDVRHVPINFAGYSISYRREGCRKKAKGNDSAQQSVKWRSHVEIDRMHYGELKAYFLHLATHRTTENLASEFSRVPFEPYAPIRRQLLNILRAANQVRKRAGFAPLPYSVLRYRRRIVKPFDPRERANAAYREHFAGGRFAG